ncbi:MAG: hypothetical protein EA378_07175 [Phycisphaerales bacterium]|nr:MAG: hypothetical protein EA378_07175 [Phycisphaerales bacterium]
MHTVPQTHAPPASPGIGEGSALTHAERALLGEVAGAMRARRWWAGAGAIQKLSVRYGADPVLVGALTPCLHELGLDALARGLTDPDAPGGQTFDAGVFEGNLAALESAEGIDPDSAAALREAWRASVSRERWHRARDGNLVSDGGSPAEIARWRGLADVIAESCEAVGRVACAEGEIHPATVLIGAEWPWGVRELHARLVAQERTMGVYRRRIIVLEPDAVAAARGLAVEDQRGALEDGRWVWFVGPEAGDRFGAWLERDPAHACPRESVLIGTHPGHTPCAQAVGERVRTFAGTQSQLAESWQREAERLYAGRDGAHWAARFRAAAAGQARLRVLLTTSRHSTFMRHSVEDLARAFEALGHETRISMELDVSTLRIRSALAKDVADFQPDALVSVNWPRWTLGPLPRELPLVCWVQDAMPHLFERRTGEAQGPFDVLAGYCFAALFAGDGLGYDPRRALPSVLPASGAKFHTGAVSPELRERFACEMAFVSHHGETPEDLRDRLAASVVRGEGGRVLVERLYRDAQEMHRLCGREPVQCTGHERVVRAFRESLGREPTGAEAARVRVSVLEPLYGRIFRHATIGWAASIARRRGWRLKLFGKRWRQSPFAAFDCGELAHGEELRACYATAGVTLQIDPISTVHQRIAECALSGGLPAPRFVADMLNCVDLDAVTEAGVGGAVADAPAGMRAASLRQRFGLAAGPALPEPPVAPGSEHLNRADLSVYDPTRLYADLGEMGFADEPGLERVVERAMEDPLWRARWSGVIRARAERHATHEGLARRLMERMGERLGAC